MEDLPTLVTRYLEAFNENDAGRRRELLGSLYMADCTYTDPHVAVDAPDQYVGFDVIVTEEGRIRNVYGFMDAAPAA